MLMQRSGRMSGFSLMLRSHDPPPAAPTPPAGAGGESLSPRKPFLEQQFIHVDGWLIGIAGDEAEEDAFAMLVSMVSSQTSNPNSVMVEHLKPIGSGMFEHQNGVAGSSEMPAASV